MIIIEKENRIVKCEICGKERILSERIGVCKDCIIHRWEKVEEKIKEIHAEARRRFGLPEEIPRAKEGVRCGICANDCRIPEGELGFCGLTKNEKGKLIRLAGTPGKGLLEYYYDPHPTNCVASWCCAASGKGYPKFSYSTGIEYGYYNLAVFYGACSFDCLFCQNWHFREMSKRLFPLVSAEELANAITPEVSCVCFFGGDPAPQLPHAIETCKIGREKKRGILRFCLETNGSENPKLLKKFAEISFESGGTIKFDLKFFEEKLSLALCGTSNKQTYKNFEMLVEFHRERKEPPFLHASTLLIPGYVDEEEVEKIVEFIASLDSTIPFSLLAFYPCFLMNDLPRTSWKHAKSCYEIAKRKLKYVRIGNVHLLE